MKKILITLALLTGLASGAASAQSADVNVINSGTTLPDADWTDDSDGTGYPDYAGDSGP